MSHIHRNAPCPCGSGKKYKKCCLNEKGTSLPQKSFGKGGKWVYAALIAIFALSIFLRYYGYQQPHGFTFDEGLYAELLANQLKEDPFHYSTQEAYRAQTAKGVRLPIYLDRPLFKHPPLFVYLITLNYILFGSTYLSAVSVSIVFGSLMVLAVFFLGKVLYDDRVGMLAAFLLCIDPTHWVCSEKIWMETTLSFFILCAMLFFVLGWHRKKYYLLSGLGIGLALLTKYPGVLPLMIIVSYALLFERSLLKERSFWLLCLVAVVVFAPWVFWNWKVTGNFYTEVIAAHNFVDYWGNLIRLLSVHKVYLLTAVFLTGFLMFIRRKFDLDLVDGSGRSPSFRNGNITWLLCVLAAVLAYSFFPFLRMMLLEAFAWKRPILVDWAYPFWGVSWDFYLMRLMELSPVLLFGFLSVFFILGNNKGDWLLLWTVLLILGAFSLLGNYQSRYILPAVPFLVLLSARWQVWALDRLSFHAQEQDQILKSVAFKVPMKILLISMAVYFTLQTLRTDLMIAIGPDYGYF
jgi:4-amino-4-deoxy-L-arabinose transferase-like glycosyltransferase